VLSGQGSGKSVLARFLASDARRTSCCVIFHSFGSSACRESSHAAAFPAGVLWNLCQQTAVSKSSNFSRWLLKFSPFQNTFPCVRDCPSTKLLSLLESLLDTLPSYTLVVDALDECTGDLQALFRYLFRLGSRPNAQVLLLARDHICRQSNLDGVCHIPINTAATQADIRHFVLQEIDRNPRLQKLGEEILEKVLYEGLGTFLHARLMIGDLNKCQTKREQRAKMESFSANLCDTYERLLTTHSLGLSETDLLRQEEILLFLIAFKEPSTTGVVCEVLALDIHTDTLEEDDLFLDPAADITRLCGPLVKVSDNGRVQLDHQSAREFLLQRRMKLEDADLFLARKCLCKLRGDKYRSWEYPSRLLRRHLLHGTSYALLEAEESTLKESVFYNYACLHFHEHVIALNDPPEDVLMKLCRFLGHNEFVTWSEVLFDLKSRSDFGAHQLVVYKDLSTWHQRIPPPDRTLYPIGDFFVAPHDRLSRELSDSNKSDDRLLPYLPFMRIGQYLNLGGNGPKDWQRAYDYKKNVVEGFTDVLGSRSPVTLRARTSLLREFFWQTRNDEAAEGLLAVSEIQRDVLGMREPDLFETLQLLGYSQYSLAKFDESIPIFQESANGFEELLGTSSSAYILTGLFKGMSVEMQGNHNEAYLLYDDVLKKWIQTHGASNPMAVFVQAALGSVLRKLGKYEMAEEMLLEAFGGRQRLYSLDVNVLVDSAMQLAILYRELGKGKKSTKFLDSVVTSSVLKNDFERRCQDAHIRAIVAFDAGEYEAPKASLMLLLHEATGAERNKNNRELLWIRITLADVMRKHGEAAEALMLFSELVEPICQGSGSAHEKITALKDEPEPPSRLMTAERALRLTKETKQSAARELLQQEKLQWVCEKDFWILQGGPIADTGWMRPVERLVTI
jgi:tetratricopeptide (TPR) repeat protein